MKATKKQLQFIRNIEDKTGYSFDFENGTKAEASKYISEHIDEYNRYIHEHYWSEFYDWSNYND